LCEYYIGGGDMKHKHQPEVLSLVFLEKIDVSIIIQWRPKLIDSTGILQHNLNKL